MSHSAPSGSSTQGSGVREIRQKATQRLGQWIKGKYRLDALLGVGGMAVVFAATHRNGSRAAIKILHAEFARDEQVRTRFLREGYVANKVDHPGRVAVLDDDETELGEPFIVMELLDGETLQQYWKRQGRKLPVLEALRIAERVLDTLVPFHDANIIHRDLKPANIFITSDKEVKILDFGVARLRETGTEGMTRAGTALGTPSFMSPEQAQGKSDQLDGRSDVFAVGATLYAILSGQRLHHGKTDNEAFILAATQPAPSLARVVPDVPIEVIALVDKSLQWDRRARFPNAAAMRDACRDLMRKLGAEPAEAAPDAAAATPAPEPTPAGATPTPRAWMPSPAAPATPPAGAPAVPSKPAAQSVEAPASRAPSQSVPPSEGAAAAEVREGLKKALGLDVLMKQAERSVSATSATDLGPEAAITAEQAQAAAQKLQDVFQQVDKAMPTFRQYGLQHPEASAKVATIHRSMIEALRSDPDNVFWVVHPFCFVFRDVPVWEPEAPNDTVPYNLTAAGVDEVRVLPGVEEEEVKRLCGTFLVDPQSKLVEDSSDAAVALWEAGFQHMKFKIRDDYTDADAAEVERFEEEADDLEEKTKKELEEATKSAADKAGYALAQALAEEIEMRIAERVESAALAAGTDKGGFAAAKAAWAPLELPAAERAAVGAQISLEPGRWRERFFELAVDAYTDAFGRGDPEVFLAPMETYVREQARKRRFKELFETYGRLLERVLAAPAGPRGERPSPAVLTMCLFKPETLRSLVLLASHPEHLDGEARTSLLTLLSQVIELVDETRLDDMLALANETHESEAQEMTLRYLERVMVGKHDAAMVERLNLMRPELAQRLLAAMVASKSHEAVEALKPLLMSPNPALRAEATALLSQSPEQLGHNLLRLLESSDGRVRQAALTTMVRYQVRHAGPGLVGLIQDAGFGKRGVDEQQRMFETLFALHAARAEDLLGGIVASHGLMADEALERSRTLAAEMLGKHAQTDRALAALDGATRVRPWNSLALRQAAAAARGTITDRLGRKLGASGGGER